MTYSGWASEQRFQVISGSGDLWRWYQLHHQYYFTRMRLTYLSSIPSNFLRWKSFNPLFNNKNKGKWAHFLCTCFKVPGVQNIVDVGGLVTNVDSIPSFNDYWPKLTSFSCSPGPWALRNVDKIFGWNFYMSIKKGRFF